MSEPNPPENTGQRVEEIINTAPSIQRTTPEQEAIKIKEQMQETKAVMEKARNRLGNFCVSIGNDSPEGERSKVVMLIEPVAGITEYDAKSMNYILVTNRGFQKLTYYPGEIDNPQTGNQKMAKEKLAQLEKAIDNAVASNGVITADNNSGYRDGEPYLKSVQIGTERDGITLGNGVGHLSAAVDVDPIMVEQALQASINVVKEQNQKLLDQTVKVLAPAQTVQGQLGPETK